MISSPFCTGILTVDFSLFLSEHNDEKVAGHFDLCLPEHAHCLCLLSSRGVCVLCEHSRGLFLVGALNLQCYNLFLHMQKANSRKAECQSC